MFSVKTQGFVFLITPFFLTNIGRAGYKSRLSGSKVRMLLNTAQMYFAFTNQVLYQEMSPSLLSTCPQKPGIPRVLDLLAHFSGHGLCGPQRGESWALTNQQCVLFMLEDCGDASCICLGQAVAHAVEMFPAKCSKGGNSSCGFALRDWHKHSFPQKSHREGSGKRGALFFFFCEFWTGYLPTLPSWDLSRFRKV